MSQGKLTRVIDKAVLEEELKETTYFKRASRSPIVFFVDPLAVAAAMEEEQGLEEFLNLDEPPLGLGGQVGQCSIICLSA